MNTISTNQLILLFLAAFTLVGLFTPLMRKIALKIHFLDKPNLYHKTHNEPIPYLGGVAIIIGICSTIGIALTTQSNHGKDIWLATSILIPALILGVIGLIDDFLSLSAFLRLVIQTVVGILTSLLLIITDTIGNPTGNLFLDAALTVLWIVGITNSINFFDNLDGGAVGTLAVISLGLFVIAQENGQFLIAATSLTIFASMLSFLIWNKSPAKIYMGDAGALFLGALISILTIRLDPDVASQTVSFSIPVLLLAIPILDTSVAVTSRIRRRISIFQGGRDHLSHRLIRNGLNKKQAAISLWSLSGVFAVMATLLAISSHHFMLLLFFSGLFWLCLFAAFIQSPND